MESGWGDKHAYDLRCLFVYEGLHSIISLGDTGGRRILLLSTGSLLAIVQRAGSNRFGNSRKKRKKSRGGRED